MTIRDRISEDLAKHYPGGKDHNQDNHGKKGNQSPPKDIVARLNERYPWADAEVTVADARMTPGELGRTLPNGLIVIHPDAKKRNSGRNMAVPGFDGIVVHEYGHRLAELADINGLRSAMVDEMTILLWGGGVDFMGKPTKPGVEKWSPATQRKAEFLISPRAAYSFNEAVAEAFVRGFYGDKKFVDFEQTLSIFSEPFSDKDDLSVAKHYPGGKDHDQSRHGRRKGGGTATRKAPKWNPLKPKPLSYHDEIYDHIIVGGDKPGNERALQKDQVVNEITHRIMRSKHREDVVAFATAVFKPKGNHPLHDMYGNYPANFNAHLRYKLGDSTHMSDEMRDRVYVKNFVDNVIDKWADMNRYQIEAVNRAVAEVFGVPNYNYHGITGINEQIMEELYSATTKTKKPIQNIWLEPDSGIPGPHPMFGPSDSTNPDYTIQYLFQTDEEAMSYVSQNPGIPVKSNESGDYFEGGTHGVASTEPIRPQYKNTPHVDPEVGRSAYRGLVHAVYENTQAEINQRKDMHGLPKGNVVLFRGLAGRKNSKWLDQKLDAWVGVYGEEWKKTQAIMGNVMDEETFPGVIYSNVELQGRPVASWSASINTAMGTFSGEGTTLAVSVPTEAIFSTAETGFGAMAEDEVLLIDSGKNVVTAIPSEQAQPWANVGNQVKMAGFGDSRGGSEDTRNAKIAWTDAFLSEFNHRGIEVDLNHPDVGTNWPSLREEIVTNVISQWDGDNFGWTDDKDEFMEEVLAS